MSDSAPSYARTHARLAAPERERASMTVLEQRVNQLGVGCFRRMEVLEHHAEFADDKMAKLVQCMQLAQTFSEQKLREHELTHTALRDQIGALRAEVGELRAGLGETTRLLTALGGSFDQSNEQLLARVTRALDEHSAGTRSQIDALHRSLERYDGRPAVEQPGALGAHGADEPRHAHAAPSVAAAGPSLADGVTGIAAHGIAAPAATTTAAPAATAGWPTSPARIAPSSAHAAARAHEALAPSTPIGAQDMATEVQRLCDQLSTVLKATCPTPTGPPARPPSAEPPMSPPEPPPRLTHGVRRPRSSPDAPSPLPRLTEPTDVPRTDWPSPRADGPSPRAASRAGSRDSPSDAAFAAISRAEEMAAISRSEMARLAERAASLERENELLRSRCASAACALSAMPP